MLVKDDVLFRLGLKIEVRDVFVSGMNVYMNKENMLSIV